MLKFNLSAVFKGARQWARQWVRSQLPWLVPLVKKLKSQAIARVWPSKSIVYYTGNSPETWTAANLKTGIGGAQTAVIYLSREWVKLGYRVTVYNRCGAKAGIYDGVEYIDYSRFNRYDRFDTLIIWEPKNLSILHYTIKAKRIWLDVHGVPKTPKHFQLDKLAKLDKIFVKSQYHRRLFDEESLPEIADRKFIVISNGADASLLEMSENEKDPYKLIYASNYIRGLEQMLLDGWPIIKREMKAVHLHIYYGWEFFDESYKRNPEKRAWKQKMIELMGQPGITDHGRVGQDELAREKSTAAIHYYASTYREVDCISVRESAMVGCVPIVTDYAALAEKPYGMRIAGDPQVQSTQEAVAWKIVELLKNPQQLAQLRQQSRELVKHETWENIAKLWLKQLS